MKKIILIVFTLLLISTVNAFACGGSCGAGSCGSNDSCGGSNSCSCRGKQAANQQNVIPANTEKIVKKEEVGNTICPIEGTKIGSMGETVKYEYNGKIYNLCCGMCIKKFEKNSKKYSKIAEKEAAKAMK